MSGSCNHPESRQTVQVRGCATPRGHRGGTRRTGLAGEREAQRVTGVAHRRADRPSRFAASVALAAPPCSRTRLLVSDLAKGIQTLADRWGVVPATPRRRLIRAGLRSHGILDASTRYRTLRCPDRFAGWLAGQKSQSSTLRQFLAEGLDALPPGHTSQVPSRRQAHHFQGGGCSGSERPVHRGFPLA